MEAETRTLSRISSYGCQKMNRSKHTMTKNFGDEKTHKPFNKHFFKRLNAVAKKPFEVNFVKSTIKHREPIFVDFFIVKYAKLIFIFFSINCATSKKLKNYKWIQIPSIWL